MQHRMQMPLFNDFPLPAQQAAAAAQHPMLAPRPIDAATIGYSNYPPSDTSPSGPSQTINAPQFYYPAPQVHPPQTWPTQPTVQDGPAQIAQTTVNYSQFQNSQPQPSSGQGSSQYKQEEYKPEYRQEEHKQAKHKHEADPQYPPPITNWANFPGQDFASASVPPYAGDTVWDKSYDGNLYPQVSIDPIPIYMRVLIVHIDEHPPWPHIPLPTATWTPLSAVRFVLTIHSPVTDTSRICGGRSGRLL
jgi:hypothetical protein